MVAKSLIFNSSFGLIASLIMLVISLATKILLTRILTASELGLFMMGQTLFGMAVFLISFGLTDAIVKYVAADQINAEKILLKCIELTINSFLLVASVSLLLIVTFYYLDQNKDLLIVLLFFLLIAPIKIINDFYGAAYQGLDKLYLKIIYGDITPAILFLMSVGTIFLINNRSLWMVIVFYLLSIVLTPYAFFGSIKLKLLTKKSISILSKDEIIKYASPLFFAGIVAWPMTLVPVFIGFITSPEQVSFYNLAISVSSFIYIGTLAAESAGLSVWSKYVSNSEISKLTYDYRLITKWGIILGSFLFMILLVTPKELVILLFDENFLPLADLLPIFATVFFINLLTGPSESILKANSETVFILRTRLIAGLITAIGIYPALKLWGIYGAISIYAVSATIGGVLMYSYRLWSKYRIHPFDWVYLRMLLSLFIALAVVRIFTQSYLLSYSPILVLLASFFIYLTCLSVLLFIFKVISNDETYLIKTIYSKLVHHKNN